jgi:hypothetical protein
MRSALAAGVGDGVGPGILSSAGVSIQWARATLENGPFWSVVLERTESRHDSDQQLGRIGSRHGQGSLSNGAYRARKVEGFRPDQRRIAD